MLCDEEYCGIGDVVKGNAPLREARNGARGRNRTTDTMIFSHVLYQLSYSPYMSCCPASTPTYKYPGGELNPDYQVENLAS